MGAGFLTSCISTSCSSCVVAGPVLGKGIVRRVDEFAFKVHVMVIGPWADLFRRMFLPGRQANAGYTNELGGRRNALLHFCRHARAHGEPLHVRVHDEITEFGDCAVRWRNSV